MTAPHAPVLFLSGAGLPSWIWDDVRAGLPPGTASDVARYPRGGSPSLADHADRVAAEAPWPAFAVVAHSIGGVVATELLSRHPARVLGLLGVAAVIPRPGRSFLRSMPFPNRLVLGAVVRLAGTRPPDKAIRAQADALPAPVTDRIVRDFEPESVRLYRDPTSARTLPAVRGYLYTSEDRGLSATVQRRSAATLQASWTSTLPTGHLPMLQDPAGVAQAVRTLSAGG